MQKLKFLSFRYALIGLDVVTKVAFCSTSYALKDSHVWDTVNQWFVVYGKPQLIHSDNGGSFISDCKLF
jgi:hypothetical protein